MAAATVLLAASALFAGPAAAQAVKAPDCAALLSWAGQLDPHASEQVAPRLAMPKGLQAPAFATLFGAPALAWSPEDVQAAKRGIDACRKEARKRRDRPADAALAAAERDVVGALPRVLAALQRARAAATQAQAAVAALPDSAALAQGLGVVAKADPAAPDLNGLRDLPREVAEPLAHLAAAFPMLPEADRAPITAALEARGSKIGSALSGDAQQAVTAAPATAAGIITLLEQRAALDKLPDPATRASLAQAIDQKVAQIRDTLRAAKPPAWVPPDCVALYAWAGMPGANQGVQVGQGSMWQMMDDARAVPVFGISAADWTDEDAALLHKLRDICRAALRANPPSPPLKDAAAKAPWLGSIDLDLIVSNARNALGGYRRALAALTATEAKIAALPDTTESLPALNATRTDPALDKVGPPERAHFAGVFNAKLAAIGAHAAEAAVKGLDAVPVTQPGDLVKLRDYASKVGQTLPAPAVQTFDAAYKRRLHDAAVQLLPQFQTTLDAMPANIEGLAAAHEAVHKLTGFAGRESAPLLQPLHAAAAKRMEAIAATMRGQACQGLLGSLDVGAAASTPLWDGRQGVALGDWICGLAAQGVTVSAWSGPGLLSDTASIKVTMPHGTLQTFSLHKAEVLPGKEMLVGFAMKDANTEQKLTVDQWAGFAAGAETGVMMDRAGCEQFASTDPDKVAAGLRPYWVRCVVMAAGLDGDPG